MNPNSVRSAIRVALGALSLGILTACGGGSTDGGGQTLADGGIRGTGSSVGPVSGFGSVFVNGIKFETGGAQFVIDDSVSNRNEDSLQKGMILRIEGKWRDDGTGDAEVVEYDDTFRGPVEGFSGLREDGTADFRVLNQTIDITPQTVIRLGTVATSLADDDFVRVSAWRDGTGYRASLVEVITARAEVEIEGPLNADSVNTDLNTFEIKGQTVRYNELEFRDGLTEADLINGDLIVEVEGTRQQLVGGAGVEIVNSEVGLADERRFQGTNGEDIEITGPVNDFTSGGDSFSINGIPVDILDDTLFDDFARADLVNGLLVEIEGDFEQGRVQGREISLREGNAEVKGPIASPDPATQTFSVGGVRVQVIPQTLITDGAGTVRQDAFNALINEPPVDVEVEGIELADDDGVFIQALKIEVEPEDGPVEFELEGKLQDLTELTIKVLDVTIQIPNDDVFKELDTRTNLEGRLDQNPPVEVEYTCEASVFICTAVSIEED